MASFQECVLDVVRAIPKGTVLTYKEVARRAGNQKAFRIVGTIMAKNQDSTIPCHRVIRSDGRVGEYNGLQRMSKSEILKKEGVIFDREGIVSSGCVS
ncbi:MAG: hypothetical protein RLZZ308_740 [Candidatus Parcubacteria bacterium]|jgi:methylated-DNA-[protein]-cysteine S-methyltransferase